MKKMTPEKKVNWIIHTIMIMMAIALIALNHYIKVIFDFPVPIIYMCTLPLFIGGIILLSKWLERSKWKDTVEEMNKKCEKEEKKSKPIPGIFGLILLAILCLGFSIGNGIDLTTGIFSNAYEPEHFLKVIVPDCIGVFTLLICSVIITVIAYNVMKKKIFTSANAKLIYSIGGIVIISVIIQNHYWETTTMMPNDTVGMIFALFGAFIVFLGRVFAIGVKMKEEQDLTI